MTYVWGLYVLIWVQVLPTPVRPKLSYQAQRIERMDFVNQSDCEWMKDWINSEHDLPNLNLIGAIPMEDCVEVPVE